MGIWALGGKGVNVNCSTRQLSSCWLTGCVHGGRGAEELILGE